ncbi:CHAT domain-containing protein [Streptomyces sp. NPDC001815]|uniref:CHAT domain-containing protein n=1 Tax=Streptomyces sp. NPDC001815 TaxID=3154526 RepID=UPI003332D94C
MGRTSGTAGQRDSGRTKLCVWSHQSLHFLPLHLIPFGEGLLADAFTITSVPSLECLFQGPAPAGGSGVLAVACGSGGVAHGLADEPSLERQAERIAEMFGSRPLTGAEATPTRVVALLGTSRFVHLAAHGTQNVQAPSFACLFLSGSASDRTGQLHAYEILACDLRGVDLVSLCACESALVRYDDMDNIHGLAAAFLRAGARAVVGALWPITAEVSDTFFLTLYTALVSGATTSTAFRTAQVETRRKHPQYRDWGAFTFRGV